MQSLYQHQGIGMYSQMAAYTTGHALSQLPADAQVVWKIGTIARQNVKIHTERNQRS